MNWTQIYNSLTPEERIEAAILILKTIEARERRLVFTGVRIIRNRRRILATVHYLNDRRNRWHLIPKFTFLFILCTVTLAVALVAIEAPPVFSAPMITAYITTLISMLAVKPPRRTRNGYALL
ncbi:MAG: hypothetical protein HY865_09400 [Chloroflexi bacterium]|nr:hypothetical protein [Chloroflexota bacterium]